MNRSVVASRRNRENVSLVEPLEMRTLLNAGELDETFGVNGIASASVDATNANLTDMAVMTDSRYVLTGTSVANVLTVMRFTAGGALDTTFGNGGRATSNIGSGAQVFAVGIQPDNRIVVGGSVGNNGFLLRYATNGKHDRSFGNGGLVTFTFNNNRSIVRGLSILSNGQIVVAGEAGAANLTNSVGLARFNSNGSLDRSFGQPTVGTTNGFTTTKFNFALNSVNTFGVSRLTVASNGALLIAGRWTDGSISPSNGDDAVAVARFDSNGVPDPRFGTSGLTLRDLGTVGESGSDVQVDSSGRPLVSPAGAGVFGVMRFLTNGRRDSDFGNNGLARASNSEGNTGDVLIQSSGQIVIGGELLSAPVLARFNDSGAVDPEFGDDGITDPLPFSGAGTVERILSAPDGTILASGSAGTSSAPLFSTAKLFSQSGPFAFAQANSLTTASTASYTFEVVYQSSEGINTATFGNGNIRITGPGGFVNTARFMSADTSQGLARVTVRYKVAAPSGGWTSARNGTYTIAVLPNQVADLLGVFVPAGNVGTFLVSIA